MTENKKLSWFGQIAAFQGQEVEVKFYVGDEIHLIKGKLVMFNLAKDSCVIETKTEIIFVRTPMYMKRAKNGA